MTDSENTPKKKGACCPITGCPVGQILFATIAAFVTIFVFDWLFHGIYMMPAYEATAELWHDETTMQANFHFSIIGQAIKAIAYATIFCWICKCSGKSCIGTGIKIGFFLGMIPAASCIASYAWMPTPLEMNLKWASGEILLGILVGIILSFICKKCSSACQKG